MSTKNSKKQKRKQLYTVAAEPERKQYSYKRVLWNIDYKFMFSISAVILAIAILIAVLKIGDLSAGEAAKLIEAIHCK